MAPYRFHVIDSYSGTPIQGADCRLYLIDPLSNPFLEKGFTDANGNIDLDSHGMTINSWAVLATGYQQKSGGGAPPNPNNVLLISTTPPPQYYIVNISAGPNGSISPSPGTYQHDLYDLIHLVATPDSGYVFDQFIINGESIKENPHDYYVSEISVITVLFAEIYVPSQYIVTVSTSGPGTTDPAPGGWIIGAGDSFSATAKPNEDASFVEWRWKGTLLSTDLTVAFIPESSGVLEAVFSQIPPPSDDMTKWLIIGGAVTIGLIAAYGILSKKH